MQLNSQPNSVHLQPGCVSVNENVTEMKSAAAGNSCSGLGKVACGSASISWSVKCYTLPYLFEKWEINLDGDTFIKIDVESFECKLLPSLVPWLLTASIKPTIHVAMHKHIEPCTPQEYSKINVLVQAYKYAWCGSRITQTQELDMEQRCGVGELILSDVAVPALLMHLPQFGKGLNLVKGSIW